METFNAIHSRRSIRKYLPNPISKTLIEEIIAAAMQAPSAHDRQPWHFIVIDDKSILSSIPNFSRYAKMCTEAPAAILICADTELEKNEYFCAQDCSAAAQNLLLACHDKGLGAVWTAAYPDKERIDGFSSLLKLPKKIIPIMLIVIGYPDETLAPKMNFDPAKIHYGRW